jgi:hypothetical protein
LLANDERQFDFIVQVDALWPNNWSLPRKEDGARRLKEKERLLGSRAVQFGDVITVDAELEFATTPRMGWKEGKGYGRIVPSNANNF